MRSTAGKGKGHPTTGHEGPEGEQMYSSTLPSTSALDEGGWSAPRPGRFTPGKDPYPLYRRLGGPQGRSGRVRKILPPPGFDPQSRYTDRAMPAAVQQVRTVISTQQREEFGQLPQVEWVFMLTLAGL